MASFEDTIEKAVQVAVKRALLAAHPVGSYYITEGSENPSEKFGGGWTKTAQGQCLWGADSSHAAGTTIAAGLPNITGEIIPHGTSNDVVSAIRTTIEAVSGAFAAVSSTNGYRAGGTAATGAQSVGRINLNASRSSSIYGNSTTVQPPARVVNIWKRTS